MAERTFVATLAKTAASSLRSATSGLLAGAGRAPTPLAAIQTRSFSRKKDNPRRVGLIGARGYTGRELIQLIDLHPNLELALVSSRELAGSRCQYYRSSTLEYSNIKPDDTHNHEVDCWIMAMPNGVAEPWIADILNHSKSNAPLILDLSADQRFNPQWVYGIPELYGRDKLKTARLISNPGCYATGSQLAIAPLLPYLAAAPHVFGVSGYSGAGTTPSPKNDVNNLKDNLIPYTLTDHLHEREISNHLGTDVFFTPHVAVWFQGISLTASIPINKKFTDADVHALFTERYKGEKLVHVLEQGDIPEVKYIAQKHYVEIGGFKVSKDGKRVVVCATIDNLLKGAATQAMQNINLALGFDELAGIHLRPEERKEHEHGVQSPAPSGDI